jgi:glycolate oxidase iron-sulfur subunit
LRRTLLARPLFGAAVSLGRAFRPLLPSALAAKVPLGGPAGEWPTTVHARKMLLLEGCVQPALAPGIDAAMARVLDRIGITLLRIAGGGCCGALPHHLDATEDGRAMARRNIDAWWPQVERGAEAIVVTASGCGVMVKDYGHFLRADPAYAAKAARIGELARDTVEVIAAEWPKIAPRVAMDRGAQRVAFHPPCTLQHGMKLKGRVEEILMAMGLELTPVRDAHLCCGSAGTYSVLQPELAAALRKNKIEALSAGRPEVIATANIGCLTHLAEATSRPVRHWIELLDDRMVGGVHPPVR